MRAAPAVLVALVLSACEGGGDPVEQATREAAARHQAAALAEGTTPPGPDPSGDGVYIEGMIAHHQAALAMAEAALRESRDPEVRRMARAAIDARTREISELRAWRPQSAER